MATFRGLVRSVEVRDDGWVEFVLVAAHSNNQPQTFFIRDLDGMPTEANRRLAQLGLLRDALARALPLEIEYTAGEQGNVVEDVIASCRASIFGRSPDRRVEGVVIGLQVLERRPVGGSPYRDEADLAAVTLLSSAGVVDGFLVDLQRPDVMTAQSMLRLLEVAHRTRRPVALRVSGVDPDERRGDAGAPTGRPFAVAAASLRAAAYVVSCEWIQLSDQGLVHSDAFIERLGQRYESYEADAAVAASHTRVVYTTAPEQVPTGDVSQNGSFAPQTLDAWVHDDSPLLARLITALRDGLKVRLGLLDGYVHEVELVCSLGSAARPVWVEVDRKVVEPVAGICENIPTIQQPTSTQLGETPVALAWIGIGYFTEGIWRLAINSAATSKLTIDGRTPCHCGSKSDDSGATNSSAKTSLYHAYLKGMHRIEVVVSSWTATQAFQLSAYRLR